MATKGLSLVGFLEEQQAVQYLQTACVPADGSPVALSMEWKLARNNLGSAIPKAGNPKISDLPAAHQPYIDQLKNEAWQAAWFDPSSGWKVKLVSVDQLLSKQLHVDKEWSAKHCGGLVAPVSLAGALSICLPLNPSPPMIRTHHQFGQSYNVRSDSLNLRLIGEGPFEMKPGEPPVIGIRVAGSMPQVQVLRFRNRCYLHNGFHRVFGLRALGLTEVPCMFKEVNKVEELEIHLGGFFGLPLLESNRPPAFGHFALGRAHAVSLRKLSRMIHVTWGMYTLPEE